MFLEPELQEITNKKEFTVSVQCRRISSISNQEVCPWRKDFKVKDGIPELVYVELDNEPVKGKDLMLPADILIYYYLSGYESDRSLYILKEDGKARDYSDEYNKFFLKFPTLPDPSI